MDANKMIGMNIRNRRIELKMSQEELAHRCGYKSKSSINKMELGVQGLTQSKIAAVAKALETTPDYIMGWGGDGKDQQLPYYIDDETAQIAQTIATNPELKQLYDAQRDLDPNDLQALYGMTLALKRKAERLDLDDPS